MEERKPDISVIIPYYNRECYIDETVQSVLSQTLEPLEIIVVNDCSRESSRRYLNRYENVCTIVDLPVNLGLAAARNAGIRAARGHFIALLDDDDIWLPEKLKIQRDYMEENPECALVHTAVWWMSPDQPETVYRRFGAWWREQVGVNQRDLMTLAQALTNDYWVIPSTMLFRTEMARAIGEFDIRFRQVEDREFIVRVCAAGYRVEGINQPLARRREGHNNLSGKRWLIFATDLKMCWKHRVLYFRVYGLRGFLWFFLEKLQAPTFGIPFVYATVQRLRRFIKSKCGIKPGYQEPVETEMPGLARSGLMANRN